MITKERQTPKAHLPDVANTSVHAPVMLNWVGMDAIDVPLTLCIDHTRHIGVTAKSNVYVSLDNEQAKGIHMSRLYKVLNHYANQGAISPNTLSLMLNEMLESHRDLSCDARLSFAFELPLLRDALLSENKGWKSYPVELVATRQDQNVDLELKVTVPYSSTCPCSAALSRQLLAQRIHARFGLNAVSEDAASAEAEVEEAKIDLNALTQWLIGPEGSVATPHSQRSYAYIKVKLLPSLNFPIEALINQVEQALKTPVQTAVKREDEQEFARLNGENLMFCEDAARKLKLALLDNSDIDDFWLKVEHQESLHPHNAVAYAVAGKRGGYQAFPQF